MIRLLFVIWGLFSPPGNPPELQMFRLRSAAQRVVLDGRIADVERSWAEAQEQIKRDQEQGRAFLEYLRSLEK